MIICSRSRGMHMGAKKWRARKFPNRREYHDRVATWPVSRNELFRSTWPVKMSAQKVATSPASWTARWPVRFSLVCGRSYIKLVFFGYDIWLNIMDPMLPLKVDGPNAVTGSRRCSAPILLEFTYKYTGLPTVGPNVPIAIGPIGAGVQWGPMVVQWTQWGPLVGKYMGPMGSLEVFRSGV